MKICIILMSCGENELHEARQRIYSQDYADIEVYEIKDLPNKKAHWHLYKYIEKKSKKYDLFVKHDGDMVLKTKTAITDIVTFFKNGSNIDIASFSVLDWCSQRAIIGMHVFSNRCRWDEYQDELFVDPTPNFPGYHKLVWCHPAPIAYHSPNPSTKQAITFGFHRGLKVLQKDRFMPNLSRSHFHYIFLQNIFDQYKIDPHKSRAAVLFGFDLARKSRRKTIDSKHDTIFDDALLEFEAHNEIAWKRFFEKKWNGDKLKIGFIFVPLKFKLWARWLIGKLLEKILFWQYRKTHTVNNRNRF